MATEKNPEFLQEFNRQVARLLDKEYPRLAGITVATFLNYVRPLEQALPQVAVSDPNRIPLLIVVKSELVAPEVAMPLVEAKGAHGSVNMVPVQPRDFHPIAGLAIPSAKIYLLTDVDTGRETLNVRPEDALRMIIQQGRYPLTLEEGVAMALHFPQTLTDKKKYNCFQMTGSRRAGDQRIPSIWVSYGKPRLGWCWDRNLHTWLGSASCGARHG